jgi:MOSC domain-containing protein YiiM/ferredoxin-NADP reductase
MEQIAIMTVPSIEESCVLDQLWQKGQLLQVRTGRVKPVFGPNMTSAIFKNPRSGSVKVTKLGCEGDEHAYEMHGGVEKALLQYCVDHYDDWKTEIPETQHLFTVGGFGENLVSSGANEYNICIGDIIQIGKKVIIQVSEPRQPCYNLNHRFQMRDMAKRVQDKRQTGWYYRIIQEGDIKAGDEMILLERLHPKWTIAQVQHYLYRDMRNKKAMKELTEMKELGKEIRDLFSARLKRQFEDQAARLVGPKEEEHDLWSDYVLVKRVHETPKILSLTFKALKLRENPEKCQPGSHVRIKLGGKLVRAYSVVSGDENCFELGISRSETSRGGSAFIHDTLREGNPLSISKMTSDFPLVTEADYHIFIAGGIGITAFLSTVERCEDKKIPYHLHYLVRSSADIAFARYLKSVTGKVTIYDSSIGNRFSAARILRKSNDLTHVYCCGSEKLMRDVADTAESNGLEKERLHFESFETSTTGDPFTVQLAESNKLLQVQSHEILLDILREAGFDIPSSCEVGNCGTCRVGVKKGRIDHRGTGLMENEKIGSMLSCVSRGIGEIVLDI